MRAMSLRFTVGKDYTDRGFVSGGNSRESVLNKGSDLSTESGNWEGKLRENLAHCKLLKHCLHSMRPSPNYVGFLSK